MLKILQARLHQYVNHEFPDVQAGFRKGRKTRDQIANIHWIIEKAGEFQKIIYFCFIEYARKFGKFSSSHRIGKGQFTFQSQRKAMTKKAQNATQLHSSHTLVK